MIRQTIFGFKLEKTKEELTAQGGLSLLAEYNHGISSKKLVDRYRADSASYQTELINALENDKVWWAITARQDAAVKAIIMEIPEAAWHEPEPGCGFEVAETVHTMNGTQISFRLIVKREVRRQGELFDGVAGYFYHAVACNLPEEQSAYAVLAPSVPIIVRH